jgi:hypothetical protein
VGAAVNSWQLLPAIRDLFSEHPEYWQHGALHLACLETVRRGLAKVILRFAHPRSYGDPADRMSCRVDSYKVGDGVKA